MDSAKKNTEHHKKDAYPLDVTRQAIINAEQPRVDSIEILYDPKNPEPKGQNPAIMEQYNQASEPSSETLRLRNYKRRQMNEFTDNYLFSQVIPSRWVTIINVINTFLLTIVLLVAFVVAFGLLMGLRIGLVPTDSMVDRIPVGSLVVIQPVDKISDIRIGDILSYTYNNKDYIHQVQSVGGGVIVMVGANSADPAYENLRHIIDFPAVKGRMVLQVPVLGYVVMFVQRYMVVVLAVFLTLLIGLMLARILIERKHQEEEYKEFLDKKTEYERQAEKEARERKKKQDEIRFTNLMHE